jgi:hypothetical protein
MQYAIHVHGCKLEAEATDNWCTPFVPKLLLTQAYRLSRDARAALDPAKAARDQPTKSR